MESALFSVLAIFAILLPVIRLADNFQIVLQRQVR
jgi:hypothetical protein